MNAKEAVSHVLSTIRPDSKTDLCQIMTEEKSDKGNGYWHNFTVFYSKLFAPIQDTPVKLFEMGLGTNDVTIPSNMGANGRFGASLFGWRRYFTHPESLIYGADIDDKTKISSASGIESFYCDQTSKESLEQLWNRPQLRDIQFDIVIDDGLHTFEGCWTMLTNSFHKVAPGGVYIVEDVNPMMFNALQSKRDDINNIGDIEFAALFVLPGGNGGDNNLLVLQKGQPKT